MLRFVKVGDFFMFVIILIFFIGPFFNKLAKPKSHNMNMILNNSIFQNLRFNYKIISGHFKTKRKRNPKRYI